MTDLAADSVVNGGVVGRKRKLEDESETKETAQKEAESEDETEDSSKASPPEADLAVGTTETTGSTKKDWGSIEVNGSMFDLKPGTYKADAIEVTIEFTPWGAVFMLSRSLEEASINGKAIRTSKKRPVAFERGKRYALKSGKTMLVAESLTVTFHVDDNTNQRLPLRKDEDSDGECCL